MPITVANKFYFFYLFTQAVVFY